MDKPAPRVLGLRADAKQVHWAVVEESSTRLVVIDRGDLMAPVMYADAAAFAWFREKIHSVILAHSPSIAAVRTPESNARGRGDGDRRRLRVEGVLMEAAYAKGLEVRQATLATIGSDLGLGSAKEAKRYQEAGGDLRGLDLAALGRPLRECVLVAAAMLPRRSD